jgi:sensor histidine kinase YesM
MKSKRRLKNYIIKPKYQFDVLLRVIFFTIFIGAFQAFVIFFLSQALLEYCSTHPMSGAEVSLLNPENLGFEFWVLALSGVFFLPLGIFLFLLGSHRSAGPVYRLEKEMRELLEGETRGPLFFRERDQFKELADLFNRLAKELEAHRKASEDSDTKS